MIDFELSFCYENENEKALRRVSGSVKEGSCVVLCGGSGCGKTTLIRCLNRLVPTFYEGVLEGSCYVAGKDIGGISAGEMGELAASVFQDPRSQFFTVNSSTETAFALENYGVSQEEMKMRVDTAFELFHLEKLKDRNVYELSSGERQLVSVLSAWALDAKLLLLDEPTANLDFAAVGRFREMLATLKKQGRTLIISEHRLHYLHGLADEYWVISHGEIIRRLSDKEIGELSQDELSSLALRAIDLNHVKISHTNENPIKPKTMETLCLRDIRFGYKKSPVLNGFSLSACTGDIVGIIGSNGSGKTTAGKLAAGFLKPLDGEVLLDGSCVKEKELQKKTLFVMQEAEFQFFTNSVMNELLYGRQDTPQLRSEIEHLLRKFDMWECRARHPFSLSGGQMQKLALMLAYLSPKPIVILDEPTAGLDEKSLKSCAELIRDMQESKIVLIITHDIELIAMVCTRCVCISNGTVEREFDLHNDNAAQEITAYMDRNFLLTDNARSDEYRQNRGRLDPRTKLLVLIAAMIAAATTNTPLVTTTSVLVMAAALVERFYKSALLGGLLWAALYGLGALFPDSFLSFAALFFPRMIVAMVGAETVIGQDEAAKTLAALRKLHFPEKAVMICAVIFRFFPVLVNDMKLMAQSVKTRNAFSEGGKKGESLLGRIEILIVPMALRVIRIAETLSASAETRGIGLKRKRASYISLKFGLWDVLFLILLVCSVALGLAL